MEAHLRKITRCLCKAVEELEHVSASEKAADEIDAAWMTRFHEGMMIPPSAQTDTANERGSAHTSPRAVGKETGKSEEFELRVGPESDNGDVRWEFLRSKWLPLLQDLHRTVAVLDLEENALQKAEEEKTKMAEDSENGDAQNSSARQNRAPPRPPKGLLSLRDYTVIHAALEIIVHWGLSPLLEPGVGVFDAERRPRSRAVKISRRVLRWGSANEDATAARQEADVASGQNQHNGGQDDDGSKCNDDDVIAERLAMCADVIQGVIFTQQFLPMLMPVYLPDLLAARLQLVYGRGASAARAVAAAAAASSASSATTSSTTAVGEAVRSGVSTKCIDAIPSKAANGELSTAATYHHREHSTAADCRKEASTATSDVSTRKLNPNSGTPDRGMESRKKDHAQTLRRLLHELGPRQVMGALRHLLSEGARAPSWLRQRAGRMLSQIVLRPGGVQATLEVYLAGAGGSGEGGEDGDEMKACLRVARLLAAPPKSVSPAEYVSRVAPQLAEMLHYDGQQRAVITRVVVMIVGSLSESMPKHTKQLVISPLLRPLTLFWGPSGRGIVRSSPSRPEPSTSSNAKAEAKASNGHTRRRAGGVAKRNEGQVTGGVLFNQAGGDSVEGVVGSDGEISSEEAIGRCVEDLEKLLTGAPAPPALLGLLSEIGVLVPLFRLHCFCKTSKSRDLQSTQRSLSALLSSFPTAARDLVTALLPAETKWPGKSNYGEPCFCPGPTGGAVLRHAMVAGIRPRGRGINSKCSPIIGKKASGDGADTEVLDNVAGPDESLLGLEDALGDLGLDPETLRLMGVGGDGTAEAMGDGIGTQKAALFAALTGLKDAEGRAQCAAGLLDELGEESSVAGRVFDILLRRYLSLRDGLVSSEKSSLSLSSPRSPAQDGKRKNASGQVSTMSSTPVDAQVVRTRCRGAEEGDSAAIDGESHAVMAAVVVLAEKLGARLFGTGTQMLSCIRLVLEHERPTAARSEASSDSGVVDAATRVAQMENDQLPGVDVSEMQRGVGIGGLTSAEDGGDNDEGDTLCSVVLGLLTTVVELGEEKRSPEEEGELRAMLGPLQALAAGHRNTEIAQMSSLLSASILSRDLTPEQRREERERVKDAVAPEGVRGDASKVSQTARMLAALDAAEADLGSEAVPIRARGVVTLTRLMRATSDTYGTAAVNMDTAVAQRLLNTYTRMAGDVDSYVYLAAVQGLAWLADALPGWCIPRLVSLFAALPTSSMPEEAHEATTPAAATTGASLPLSQRLKIGEAVVLSARRCGEAMPKYARYFVNAFVAAARERPEATAVARPREHKEGSSLSPSSAGAPSQLERKERSHFRASCLSNLAEVCQLLRWSLGRYSQDVIDLGCGVLSMETGDSEEATLARRGAAFLLGRLLRGAEGDLLQILPPDQLRATYRALKRTAKKDTDDVTRSHARNGLTHLDVAIRGQLFPSGGGLNDGRGGVGSGEAVIGERDDTGQGSSDSHHPGITML